MTNAIKGDIEIGYKVIEYVDIYIHIMEWSHTSCFVKFFEVKFMKTTNPYNLIKTIFTTTTLTRVHYGNNNCTSLERQNGHKKKQQNLKSTLPI